MLKHFSILLFPGRLRVMGCVALGKDQVCMGNTCWPNLKGLAHEFVLRVDLAVVVPQRRLRPTRRDRRVMANLLGDIAILLVEANVFKRFALGELSASEEDRIRARRTYKHGVEGLGNATDC